MGGVSGGGTGNRGAAWESLFTLADLEAPEEVSRDTWGVWGLGVLGVWQKGPQVEAAHDWAGDWHGGVRGDFGGGVGGFWKERELWWGPGSYQFFYVSG